ncbi:MAG: type II toxin-antitoxin system Phd/YefM family antitoxin, partial [Hyphomicrobiales bacterium]|nr:type II toxin-antitoxin system Phd/YefM family antitoxin [Hyphomicrobiales bacterium]
MKRVTSSEAARNFSQLSDLALSDPVVVTKNGRDRLVLLGIDEYNFLIDTIDELSAKNSDAAPPRLG